MCDSPRSGPSWCGSTCYRGKEYFYRACLDCGSIYCDPMPDDVALAAMYGPDYARAFEDAPGVPDPKEPGRVIETLKGLGSGLFLDYGCGGGELLERAAQAGWQTVGVEIDPDVAQRTAERTGLRVVSSKTIHAEGNGIANVLHLGDVIEHLTRPNKQMPPIVNLIKPGGYLIAQGPLEANPHLFLWALSGSRFFRPARRAGTPPYHVTLATRQGQQAFFERFSLRPVTFSMHEVAWPAPARLSLAQMMRPRDLGLFVLRKLSQGFSRLRPQTWGNRYFYVGRRPG